MKPVLLHPLVTSFFHSVAQGCETDLIPDLEIPNRPVLFSLKKPTAEDSLTARLVHDQPKADGGKRMVASLLCDHPLSEYIPISPQSF